MSEWVRLWTASRKDEGKRKEWDDDRNKWEVKPCVTPISEEEGSRTLGPSCCQSCEQSCSEELAVCTHRSEEGKCYLYICESDRLWRKTDTPPLPHIFVLFRLEPYGGPWLGWQMKVGWLRYETRFRREIVQKYGICCVSGPGNANWNMQGFC